MHHRTAMPTLPFMVVDNMVLIMAAAVRPIIIMVTITNHVEATTITTITKAVTVAGA